MDKRTLGRVIFLCASLKLVACAPVKVTSGCAPETGLTVSQIYRQAMRDSASNDRSKLVQVSPFKDIPISHAKETLHLFKALDNPAIPIYIYPHVALIGDEELIKPGYTTAFYLYKQNQLALASEQY